MSDSRGIHSAYALAREKYDHLGVDTETAIRRLSEVSLSLHCWQGDDVAGFERPGAKLEGGGLQVTGSYPGRARNVEELRADLEKAFSLIPGRHRLNLHAIYGEFGGKPVDRNAIEPVHYQGWIEWARGHSLGLDFNCTCFSHPKADSGFTLSHKDSDIRSFWVEHVKRCREIAAHMGRALTSPCIHNLWIPDGMKDAPVDRWTHRALLKESLDEIFVADYSPTEMKDSLESKLFGIGSESFVVGSHEFYLGYVLSKGKMVCFDLGHYHPTESVADKISAVLQFSEELLLHISRGVRWDSDHVVVLDDELKAVAEEIVRAQALDRVHLALDYFDASMNRVGAWVIGARAVLRGLLRALLEPHARLKEIEEEGDYFRRLGLLDYLKDMPFGAVWDQCCLQMDSPAEGTWINEVERYDQQVTRKRCE